MATLAKSQSLSLQKIGLLGRLSYVQYAFEPNTRDDGSKQYQLTFIYPKTADDSALTELVFDTCEEAWPGKTRAKMEAGKLKNPFLDGDGPQGKNADGSQKPELAGMKFIRLISGVDFPPQMLVQRNGAFVPATKRDISSGDYGYPVVNVVAWNNAKQGDGASFGFSHVLKARDGEPLGSGGSAPAEVYFEKIEDEGGAPASTKTGAGASGLFG